MQSSNRYRCHVSYIFFLGRNNAKKFMLAAYNYLHDLIWQVMKKINDILTA